MRTILPLIVAVCICHGLSAQSPTLKKDTLQLEEVVVTAGRLPEKRTGVPVQIAAISPQDIRSWNSQTSADVLQQTGKVFVQRSQMGGGSPVLRGFEANRVLIVVDGVRMNNAIYRAGHLQNVITIDPNIQERVEVMFGPGSVMYGSDALGGVMRFSTKNAGFSKDGKTAAATNAFARYSSANREKSIHADLNIGLEKWAFLSSVTLSDFGDLRAGTRDNPFQAYQWRSSMYAARISNRDTALANPDPAVQRPSGYRQMDLLQKIAFRPGPHTQHILNFQYSNSSGVPRYDRLWQTTNGKPDFAEWHYGPQKRLFAAYTLQTTQPTRLHDEARFVASYQNIGESRQSRRFGRDTRTTRMESINILGFNADLAKKTGAKTEFSYGGEWYHNNVQSAASQNSISTGSQTPATTRYPNGGSQMDFGGIYTRLKWQAGKRLLLVPAVRLSCVSLDAKTTDARFSPFFTSVSQRNVAANGQLGGVLDLSKGWRLTSAVSTGFRAPNVADLGKTFESNAADGLTIPNTGLRPEQTVNADLGIEKSVAGRIRLELNGFHTWMFDAIRLVPAQFDGRDSVVFDGGQAKVLQNTNTARAAVYGLYAGAEVLLNRHFSASGTVNYTIGRDVSAGVPLDHIPPVYGRLGLRGTTGDKRLAGEFFVMYNGWKRLARYSPSGEDNLQYAIPTQGMPAWYTLNLRGSYRLGQYVQAQLGVENLTNTHYRVFSSGISAPGRNVIFALRGNF